MRITHEGIYCPACTENSVMPGLPTCDWAKGWIKTEQEFPPKDGNYLVCNHPENQIDLGMLYYDGYGFAYLDMGYREPLYWRHPHKHNKQYGKRDD